MMPILLKIPLFGGLPLYTYGLMAALGFIAAMTWVKYESKREGLPVERMMDLVFLMILVAIIGSRLLFVILNWSSFASRPWAVFKLWEGGLVWYGGLIPCIAVGAVFIRKHRLSFTQIADIFAPAISLGHVFGRIGCLAAGCCYGRQAPSSAFWTVVFREVEGTLAPTGIPLYATQVYEAAGEFLLFCFIVIWRRRRHFTGEVILFYLLGYSILRLVVEHFRGDLPHGVFGIAGVTVTQLVSGLLFIVSLVLWAYRWRTARGAPPSASGGR